MTRQRLFVLTIQRQSDTPWQPQRAWEKKQREAHEDLKYLRQVRVFATVVCLLQHYADHDDLQHLCRAWCFTKLGQRFPVLTRELFNIAVLRSFAGVQLQVNEDISTDTICTTPRCTCRWRMSREPHRRAAIRLCIRSSTERSRLFHDSVSVSTGTSREKTVSAMLLLLLAVAIQGGRLVDVSVPEYVAASQITKADAKRDLQLDPVAVPLRYDIFPRPPMRPGAARNRTRELNNQDTCLAQV